MSKSPILNRTLAGVLIPFILATGLVVFQTSGLADRLRDNMASELDTVFSHVAHDMTGHLKMTRQLARVLAESPDIVRAFETRHNDLLFQRGVRLINTGMVSRVSFVNEEGIVLARSHMEFGFNDPFKYPALIEKARDDGGISGIIKTEAGWVFRSAVPVVQYDVVFLGIVIVELDITPAFLAELAKGFGLTQLRLSWEQPGQDRVGFGESGPADDLLSLTLPLFAADAIDRPWLTIVKNEKPRMDEIRRLIGRLLAITVSAVVLAVVLIIWTTRASLRPVRDMHRYLDRFRNGRLSLRDLIQQLAPFRDARDELGGIAGSVMKTLDRLEDVQENLEQMVDLRTAELEARTRQLTDEIREREKAEQEYRLLVENATDAICIVQDERIKFPNPRALELFGMDAQTLGESHFMDFIHPADQEMVVGRHQQRLKGETPPDSYTFRIINADGDTRWARLNTVFTPWKNRPATLNFIRDITDLRQTRETLIQSEKMLSVGGLAAGMAHEINNPLAGMMQNAQLAANRLSPDLPANQKAADEAGISLAALGEYLEKREILNALDRVHNSGKQAAEIVRNMLSFAKKESGKSPHNICDILDNALLLAQNDYNLAKAYDFKSIRVDRSYAPDLPPVQCEQSKIQQVLFNLLKNAAEAMAGADMDAPPTILLRAFSKEKQVCVEIRDNGPGMDETTRKRVFEPFFTTKPVDKGTGLGLSISYFIVVEDHGGSLEVTSEPAEGTQFSICLPSAGPI